MTKSDGTPNPTLETLIRQHNPDAELIECTHQPQYLQAVGSGEHLSLSHLQGAHIAAFSGIAVPENFENMLRSFGAEIRYNQRFLDHHRFSEQEIHHVFEQAKAANVDFIVTTEKDAVRLSACQQAPCHSIFCDLKLTFYLGAVISLRPWIEFVFREMTIEGALE